jgi:hypothetical protein
MAFDGECITEVFTLVAENPLREIPELDIPKSNIRDCCDAFSIKALADASTIDEFKNDKAGFLWWFDSFIISSNLILQKFNNTTKVFEDLIALTDDTYGTNYNYGFFENDNEEKFIGYKMEWRNVLMIHGAGGYRVKCTATTAIADTLDIYSANYCLKQYTPERADITVRIEYYLNNITGISDNDKKIKDFGNLDWYNSFRLNGFFGFPSSTYQSEYVEYNNGQRQWVEDEQEVEYTLKLKQTPSFIHETMRTDVLQADRIFITDYNSNNPLKFVKKQVIKNGEYSPDWKRLQTKLAGVEVKFKQEYNNLKKLRC